MRAVSLHTEPNPQRLAETVADFILETARQSVAERGCFVFAAAGGKTPEKTYQLLAHPPRSNTIDWRYVHIFFGDERCVPMDDKRSNANMLQRVLLDSIVIPRRNVHPIPGEEGPQCGCRHYEAALQMFFQGRLPRFDLVLLGLGDDGHTASLFPNSPALSEMNTWVTDAVAPDGVARITLTLPVLNNARTVAFLVSGHSKADAFKRACIRRDTQLPAARVMPGSGRLYWFADSAAASP